jgi:hypothetical protein
MLFAQLSTAFQVFICMFATNLNETNPRKCTLCVAAGFHTRFCDVGCTVTWPCTSQASLTSWSYMFTHAEFVDVCSGELSCFNSREDQQGRRLGTTGTRQPIRITFNTSAVTTATLTTAQVTLLTNTLLPDVRNVLSSLLAVDPVPANLFASRTCLSALTGSGVCVQYSTNLPTCGSMTIPVSLVGPAYSSCSSYTNVCMR